MIMYMYCLSLQKRSRSRDRRRSRSHSRDRRSRSRSKTRRSRSGSRSRGKKDRRHSRSRSRERHRRSRSRDRERRRRRPRRRRRRRRNRSRDRRMRQQRSASRSRSRSPQRKKNEPLSFKEKLKASLMEVQKKASEGKLSLEDLANSSGLAGKETHVDGLVQDCCNSSVLAMELLQSCTKPSMCRTGNDCSVHFLVKIYSVKRKTRTIQMWEEFGPLMRNIWFKCLTNNMINHTKYPVRKF